jgi:hypothetical protein
MPLFSRQAVRQFVGAGLQLDRFPVDTTGRSRPLTGRLYQPPWSLTRM